jgi:hypothetical protein
MSDESDRIKRSRHPGGRGDSSSLETPRRKESDRSKRRVV